MTYFVYNSLLIIAPLFANALNTHCPAELRNCSCAGGNTVTCSQRGYLALEEGITLDLNIKHLYFDQNGLEEINDNHFKNMRSLTYLTLRENKISNISEDAFHNVGGLLTLDLSYNSLSYLPKKLFEPLTFLENIYLNNNKLRRIENKHFTHLQALQDVRMDENQLNYIGADAFVNSDGITKLYLEYNQLEIPHKNWLIHFSHTGEYEVYLDGNPWSCDCRMKRFLEWAEHSPWFLKHERDGVSVPECSTPTSLRGTNLARIGSESDLICVNVNITSQIRDIKTVEGQKVVIACDAIGFPLPHVVLMSPKGNIINSSNKGYAADVIDNPRLEHSGDYLCNASGYDEEAVATYQVITIKLTVYRSPGHVVSLVLIGLFVVAVVLGGLVWIYRRKFGAKSQYGRLPKTSGYDDQPAKFSTRPAYSSHGETAAQLSVSNPYGTATDLQYDDDEVAEYDKDTEFLV